MMNAASPAETPQWFVVQTRAGMEKAADRSIEKLGFDHYLPMFSRMVSHGGKRERVARPLYPLYTFVSFALDEDWGNILRVVGVQTILGINRLPGMPKAAGARPTAMTDRHSMAKRPLPLRDIDGMSVIKILKDNAAANHGFVELGPVEKPRLNHGDVVRIVDGPFADFEGLVDRDQKTRVFVLLDFLGRETQIPFERDSLDLMRRAGKDHPSVGTLTQISA